mgnify:CR=1 FL=1
MGDEKKIVCWGCVFFFFFLALRVRYMSNLFFKNLPNSENILNNSINMIVNFPEDEDTYKIYYTQYFRFSVQQLLNIRKKKIQGS